MASIPLPALHVQPPQDPTSGLERMMALKGMMQDQQLQDINIQQHQQQLKDQQTLLSLYQKHNGDLDGVIKDAPDAGVTPQSIQALQLHAIDVKTKTQALVAAQGTEAARQADLVLGSHDVVDKAAPEDKPAVYVRELAGLNKAGVDTSQFPQAYPGDEQFKLLGVVARGHSKNVDDALKAQQTAEAGAKAAEATAAANKTNLETSMFAGPLAESRYRGILQKIAAKQMVTPDEQNFAKAYEASQAKNTTQSDSLGITSNNASRPAGLLVVGAPGARPAGAGGGAPAASVKGSLVDMIGQYKADPMTMSRMMMRHPDILAAVHQKYPDFDQTDYVSKNKLMAGFTSGSQSKEINAINTALGHVGVLNSAIDGLKNNDMQALNRVANFVGVQTGNDAVTTFNTIVHRVGPELTAAYVQGGGGEAERGTTQKDFDPALGPDQLKNNVSITANLLRSKISSLENQYTNTVKRNDFQQRFITPDAQKTLNAVGARTQSLTQGGAERRQYQGATYEKQPDGSWKKVQ